MFISRQGDATLIAGLGLGFYYTNVFCFSIVFGMASALDTLVSQAFGAKNLVLCG
jgi:Na+-driven multidrug efflux pump